MKKEKMDDKCDTCKHLDPTHDVCLLRRAVWAKNRELFPDVMSKEDVSRITELVIAKNSCIGDSAWEEKP